MIPWQAFLNGRVKKIKGYGKDRVGTIVEVNLLSNTMLVEFDDNKLREWVSPYDFQSLPRNDPGFVSRETNP